jgi:hypothetical protein
MRSVLFAAALLLLPLGAAAQSVPVNYPPLSARATADLDRTWARYQKREPNSGSRDLCTFLLTVVAHRWRPDNWAQLIDLIEELHDRDPASATYGNYRWYWREPKPNDRNAVEFCMQTAGLVWVVYRDRLPEAARQKLAAALALASEGLVRHKIDVSYTNIFLMRLANCILIGETTDQPALVQRGRAWLDEWLAYTRANGVHEFSSPTYYGVDVEDLGALARFSKTPEVRTKAERALNLFWTDIAANWFTPYEGIAGAHSRDYGFLTGHGYLDQQLLRAHWLGSVSVPSETRPALDDLTQWTPPASVRTTVGDAPRTVSQQWGAHPWERATHYVGRHFSLGTAGGGYGAQDKVLALTLSGGPAMPIVNFSVDYRRDPYGQGKIATADGHEKLTHLLPFVCSVQRGAEALLLAACDPAKARNPAGGKTPIEYAGVWATFVVPAAAELSTADGPLARDASEVSLGTDSTLFLRYGETAAAIRFVLARNDAGLPARILVAHDGAKVGACRLTAVLADDAPRGRVVAATWVRAAEGLKSEAAFAAFRRTFLEADAHASAKLEGDRAEIIVPGLAGSLKLVADLRKEERLIVEGADPAMQRGILNVDGRDLGAACLR